MSVDGRAPMVSVVMPVYNAAPFLRPAIDSILKQTYPDFECILINDGSTDSSAEIIRSYSDPRIKLIEQQNQGVAKTLNNALGYIRGKYTWRHDADDTSLPGKLESQVAFLEAHPEFALCATQVAFMTERGKIAWDYRQPRNDFFGDKPYLEVSRADFKPYSPITHATVLIRTDALKDLGGYRTAFKTAEDVDLWLRLLQKYRAVVLNQCDYFVRLNRSSATQVQGWKNAFFRNLAFEYYDQRNNKGQDNLERGEQVVLPEPPTINHQNRETLTGKVMRHDLLDYNYRLHLNAKDWLACVEMAKYSIRDGWKLAETWKALVFPFLAPWFVGSIVKMKKRFK
ncbi:glycosyltransferase family 2 protein [Flavihumibacter fluvii]|uniref:glycosyltransferase family 2 protein n=1 Tax=Flavihumibacter fluvii TaxID=2838157 RepID=UPI001BDF2430|nr:glycosyltransferase family A protein [Flavihumibacter fluvii]ULQ52394.1 glycosyltransferase family 2 protein [Flavihumibacter fluvii]